MSTADLQKRRTEIERKIADDDFGVAWGLSRWISHAHEKDKVLKEKQTIDAELARREHANRKIIRKSESPTPTAKASVAPDDIRPGGMRHSEPLKLWLGKRTDDVRAEYFDTRGTRIESKVKPTMTDFGEINIYGHRQWVIQFDPEGLGETDLPTSPEIELAKKRIAELPPGKERDAAIDAAADAVVDAELKGPPDVELASKRATELPPGKERDAAVEALQRAEEKAEARWNQSITVRGDNDTLEVILDRDGPNRHVLWANARCSRIQSYGEPIIKMDGDKWVIEFKEEK